MRNGNDQYLSTDFLTPMIERMNKSRDTKTPIKAPPIINSRGKYVAPYFSFHVAIIVTGSKNVVNQTIGKDRASNPTVQFIPSESIQA